MVVKFFHLECLLPLFHQGLWDLSNNSNREKGFYLLKWGSIEIYRSSLVGRTHINYRNAGEIFGCVPLLESETTAIYRASAVALSKSEIWFLGRDRFLQLTNTYPDFQGAINYFLAQDLAYFAQRAAKEQERILKFYKYNLIDKNTFYFI